MTGCAICWLSPTKASNSREQYAFSWAHNGNDGTEYAAFVAENASGGGQLLFGRVTYSGQWPIVAQLAPERPINEHQMMVDLVALGNGRTMFEADEDQGVQEWEVLPKLRDGLRDDIS